MCSIADPWNAVHDAPVSPSEGRARSGVPTAGKSDFGLWGQRVSLNLRALDRRGLFNFKSAPSP
jgi:hypothetical protein